MKVQADAHPGNILVMPGAKIGLIDYGQSKQLPDQERLAFAALLVELAKGRRRCLSLPHSLTALTSTFTSCSNARYLWG